MSKVLTFNNVYLVESSLVGGKKESEGPLRDYFDELYEDLHMGQKTFEQAEIFMQKNIVASLLKKTGLSTEDIDVAYSGDLINQDIISNYTFRDYEIPLIGIYGACSTSVLGILNAAIFLNNKEDSYALSLSSSHNSTSERQFRNPTEYGGAKAKTLTSTVTGASGFIFGNKKTSIRVTKGLIGKVIDLDEKNMFDMGRAMAPAASESLLEFFEKTNTTPKDYDLILTGDLSTYGSQIIRKILDEKFNYSFNYDDCGLLIYDKDKQNVFAGASGCSSCGCVTAGYVISALRKGTLKKVLIAATGALMNTMMILQHNSIPAISHVVLLEREA